VSATQCLRDEHKVILKALACFDLALGDARTHKRVTKEEFAPFIKFFQDYAVFCHHAKEEGCLFPCIEDCGTAEMKRQMQVLLEEHTRARQFVKLMAENLEDADAGDPIATSLFLDQAQNYRDLLIGHIGGEDFRLFILADNEITGEDLKNLNAVYETTLGQKDQQDIATRNEALINRLITQIRSKTHG